MSCFGRRWTVAAAAILVLTALPPGIRGGGASAGALDGPAVDADGSTWEATSTLDQDGELRTITQQLPANLSGELSRVVEAYGFLQQAAQTQERLVYPPQDDSFLDREETIREAQALLLEEVKDISAEQLRLAAQSVGLAETIRSPPAFALDLAGSDTVYTLDYAFVLDVGGNDTYRNNAGGSSRIDTDCPTPTNRDPANPVGMLVDLAGNDSYVSGRGCGVNGGAYGSGVGFLYDAQGDDVYGGPGEAVRFDGKVSSTISQPGTDRSSDAGVPLAHMDGLIVGLRSIPSSLNQGDLLFGHPISDIDRSLEFVVLDIPEAGLQAVAADLESKPSVVYTEPNRVERIHQGTPDDPRFGDQYGPAQVRAVEAWDQTTGDPSKVICIVDSGLRYTHEEFVGRYVGGHDFVNDDADPWDDNGHGTHVTGIAAAGVDNGVGIAGIANAGILSSKATDQGGLASTSDLASAIAWCADQGADVINMSLGGSYSSAMEDAVEYAGEHGSLMVAAAGNDGCSSRCVRYPAAFPEVIAVTCTDEYEDICSSSSRGIQAELAAPGDEILSTIRSGDDQYGTMSGTSMSAPHVAGIAALLWSAMPDLSQGEVREILSATARDMGPGGCDVIFGHGLVDANASIEMAASQEIPSSVGMQGCTSASLGFNGGGAYLGVGFLYDGGGDDRYEGHMRGVNGGGYRGGFGSLIDRSGEDVYRASREGTNGGAYDGRGALLDLGIGSDTYVGGERGSNGGSVGFLNGWSPVQSLLFDQGGNDVYEAQSQGTNGGAHGDARARLLDCVGDDSYIAGDEGTNGGGFNRGVGTLVDVSGDDTYRAGQDGVNGGGYAKGGPGTGILMDLRGTDTYEDQEGGSGEDRTVMPKGRYGAQVDRTEGLRMETCTTGGGLWGLSPLHQG